MTRMALCVHVGAASRLCCVLWCQSMAGQANIRHNFLAKICPHL
jgi:hypothetical protein